MLDTLIGQLDACARTSDARAAAFGFAEALKPYGLNGLATRSYTLPEGPLTSQSHWDAIGSVATVWPPGWAGTQGNRYICFEENPLLEALKQRHGSFRFTDLAPRAKHGTYWEAFSEGRISEGLGVIAYGPGRRVSSLSMTFERLELSPAEAAMMRAAGSVLTERTAVLAAPDAPAVRLTGREYDCLAYVAAGKSDWEISVILNLSQSTVRFHVDNARRKLEAATRAHAVARATASGLI